MVGGAPARGRPAEEPLWDGVGYEEPMLSLDNPLCSMPLAPEDILLQREAVEQVPLASDL